MTKRKRLPSGGTGERLERIDKLGLLCAAFTAIVNLQSLYTKDLEPSEPVRLPSITPEALAELILQSRSKLGVSTMRRALSELVGAGFISRHGSTRTGYRYWVTNEQGKRFVEYMAERRVFFSMDTEGNLSVRRYPVPEPEPLEVPELRIIIPAELERLLYEKLPPEALAELEAYLEPGGAGGSYLPAPELLELLEALERLIPAELLELELLELMVQVRKQISQKNK